MMLTDDSTASSSADGESIAGIVDELRHAPPFRGRRIAEVLASNG